MVARYFAAAALAGLVTAATAQRRTGHRPIPRRSDPDPEHGRQRRGQGEADHLLLDRELPHPHASPTARAAGACGWWSTRCTATARRRSRPRSSTAPRAAEFHAFLSAAGKLGDLEAVDATPAALRVQGFLTDFFPWVKAGVKAGEQWADTSAKATTDGTDSVVVKRVTAYRVVGKDDPREAEGAPDLERIQLVGGRHAADAERARPDRGLGQGHRQSTS